MIISNAGKKILKYKIEELKQDKNIFAEQVRNYEHSYEKALRNKQIYTDKVAEVDASIAELEGDVSE